MAMIVKHNLQAMNSNRMLGVNSSTLAKSTEKLSSGYKINRAADDAAGLAISEKMRKQVRGLTQASLNAQDGISTVQTAEGALNEVQDMIQRMNELAVKASNGTNSQEERDYIQDEVDQLITEIDRVAETTKFNELYLLKGDGTTETEVTVPAQAEVAVKATYKNAIVDSVALQNGKTAPDAWFAKDSVLAMTSTEILASLEVDGDGNVVIKEGVEIFSAAATPNAEFGAQTTDKAIDDAAVQALYQKTTNALTRDAAGTTPIAEEDLADYFNVDGSLKTSVYAQKADGTAYAAVGAERIAEFVNVTPGKEAVAETTETKTVRKALELSLHVGAESAVSNKITVTIKSMDAESIGVKGLKVDTEADATAAIDKLNASLRTISEQRAELGAVQNRLEHTINNLDNVVENTTAAEAQIRDTDMATEMVKYSNNQILAQAGQAMLAQANQANQGVLSLLQ